MGEQEELRAPETEGGASATPLASVPPSTPATRSPFVPGHHIGRPKGSKNRATIVKRFIEEQLTNELKKDAVAILRKAVKMAKDGDRAMIKLLLGDLLADARRTDTEDSKGNNKTVVVIVRDLARPDVIDAEVIEHGRTEQDGEPAEFQPTE